MWSRFRDFFVAPTPLHDNGRDPPWWLDMSTGTGNQPIKMEIKRIFPTLSHRIHGANGIFSYPFTIKINHSCRWIYQPPWIRSGFFQTDQHIGRFNTSVNSVVDEASMDNTLRMWDTEPLLHAAGRPSGVHGLPGRTDGDHGLGSPPESLPFFQAVGKAICLQQLRRAWTLRWKAC